MANHSRQSSMPTHTCHTSQYRLTFQSIRHSQSIQSLKPSLPRLSCRSNRYSRSNHSIQPSIPINTSHTSHSILPLTLTSNKSTHPCLANRSRQSSLPIHGCRTIHFTRYFLRSQSSLPDVSLRGFRGLPKCPRKGVGYGNPKF